MDNYKETLFSALIKANKPLRDASTVSLATVPATSPGTTDTSSTKAIAVRLPKLHLNQFNGDLTKWTSFWQFFEVAVDSNLDLSGVEKV